MPPYSERLLFLSKLCFCFLAWAGICHHFTFVTQKKNFTKKVLTKLNFILYVSHIYHDRRKIIILLNFVYWNYSRYYIEKRSILHAKPNKRHLFSRNSEYLGDVYTNIWRVTWADFHEWMKVLSTNKVIRKFVVVFIRRCFVNNKGLNVISSENIYLYLM